MPQIIESLPAVWETRVQSLGQDNPLEKEMATHSSILAWKIPWTEEPDRLQSMRLQRVGHNWVTNTLIMSDGEHFFMCLLAICMPSLEKYVYDFCPLFWLGCLFLWYWLVWAVCMFWKWILCQLFQLLLFSPIPSMLFHFLYSFHCYANT